MGQLMRYILIQVALASLVVVVSLSAAIWLTQSLRFIEWTVNRGLPFSTFLFIAVLVLPSFMVVILPIATFAAVLFTYNKLQSDSEIIVMRAVVAGVMLVAYALNLYLLPASYREFKDLQFQIRNNYSSVLLQEGVFTPLEKGLTIFVREQGERGELLGIMVQDDRQQAKPITMVAETGAHHHD
jgi:lipopolysaccharide export system permease protein